jgi:ABC-2 type transport system permease protein
MSRATPSFYRTLLILSRLRFKRLMHSWNKQKLFSSRKTPTTPGRTNPVSRGAGPALGLFVAFGLFFTFAMIHYGLQSRLLAEYPSAEAPNDYFLLEAVLLGLVLITGLLNTIATQELVKPEWDLEWLMTMPVSKGSLMLGRILERAFIFPALYLFFYPALVLILFHDGWSWWSSALLAFFAELPAFLLMAVLQTILDTGLKMQVGPARLRNLKAFLNIVGMALLYLILLDASGVPSMLVKIKDLVGPEFLYSPPGLLLRGLTTRGGELRPVYFAAYVAQCLMLSGVGYMVLLYQIRNGVTSSHGQAAGRKKNRAPAKIRTRERFALPALARRELLLLSRDHAYLTQTLLIPLLIMGLQLYIKSGGELRQLSDGTLLAAAAFGSASYSLMFSAFQVLNSEGQALWIWWTLPQPLEKLVLDKVLNWFFTALAFALLFIVLAVLAASKITPDFVLRFSVALLGVPIFTMIATSLGIYSYLGHTAEAQPKIRPTLAYLYLLLNGVYIGALFAPLYSVTLIATLLMAFLAYALWLGARAKLPTIMDPSASRPRAPTLLQGIAAVQIYFWLHALFEIGWLKSGGALSTSQAVFSYTGAGVVTAVIFLIYWSFDKSAQANTEAQMKAPKLWHFLRPTRASRRLMPDLRNGAALGISLALLFTSVLAGVERLKIFGPAGITYLDSQAISATSFWAVFAAALLVVPLIEELLFRGLLYASVLEQVRPLHAIMVVAFLYALIADQTPSALGFLALLSLGLTCGWLRKRTGGLSAPWAAHVAFNLGIFLFLPWLRGI